MWVYKLVWPQLRHVDDVVSSLSTLLSLPLLEEQDKLAAHSPWAVKIPHAWAVLLPHQHGLALEAELRQKVVSHAQPLREHLIAGEDIHIAVVGRGWEQTLHHVLERGNGDLRSLVIGDLASVLLSVLGHRHVGLIVHTERRVSDNAGNLTLLLETLAEIDGVSVPYQMVQFLAQGAIRFLPEW